MVAEAGNSKLGGDPGLHNKPLGCGASEVYALGPACEEEEEVWISAVLSLQRASHCMISTCALVNL